MKKLFLTLGCLSLALFTFSQTHFLVPFRDGDKWGYADTLGKIVIACKYQEANLFDYNAAMPQLPSAAIVKLDGHIMAINEKGTIIVPAKYESITINHTHDGLSFIVENKYGRKGLFQDGKELIPCIYEQITPDANDSYLVQKNDLFGMINSSGKVIVPVMYDDVLANTSHPNSMVQWTAAKRGMKKTFTDRPVNEYSTTYTRQETHTNDILNENEFSIRLDSVEANYPAFEVISNDNFAVLQNDNQTGIIFSEDSTNTPFFFSRPYRFDDFRFFPDHSGGRERYQARAFIIARMENKLGIITEKEKFMLPMEYDDITLEGNIFFLKKNGKTGFFILHTSYPAIEAKYDAFLYNYSIPVKDNWRFGLFLVKQGDKTGYVGENGVEFFR
jgi:hypothetical protein